MLFYLTRWATGSCRPSPIESWLGEGSFGFTGAGGHLGLGNTQMRVGLAYTMTKMYGNLTGDPRPRAVLEALKECLS